MKLWLGAVPVGAGLAVALAALTAVAEDTVPSRLQGQISEVNGQSLSVKTSDGKTTQVTLTPDAHIFNMVKTKSDAIGTDTLIGAVGPQTPDERIKAETVVIFPKDLQGAGAGYFSQDTKKGTAMRQGSVQEVTSEKDGRVVKIYSPQAGATILIPPDAKVMTLEPGDQKLLTKGAHVIVPAAKRQDDGSYTADALAVGEQGAVPPG
ncbi:MAG: hypothetical protein ACJ8H8_05890 [Geminicoccaceae bacterium]